MTRETGGLILVFLLFNFCLSFPLLAEEMPKETGIYEETTEVKPQMSEEDMEIIRERMMILTSSLGGMPQPPKMDKKIKIPAVNLGSNTQS